MSANSGIGISKELSETFSSAVESRDVRFLKVSIQNEQLVPDNTTFTNGSLEEDLEKLPDILEDNTPAYILTRTDSQASDWLAISYVPDTAKVRDKMLYASTRNTLTKSLGATHFTDALFATSKADLTPAAYAAHRAHISAPKPMSLQEQEMEAVRAAERQAGSGAYESGQARRTHLGTGVGLAWSEEVENAVTGLGEDESNRLVIISIDPATETLVLSSSEERTVDEVASSLPSSEPSYAFFSWKQSQRRDIVFIYSCPSSSPVKHRMLYSSGSSSVLQTAKPLLASSSATLSSRKIETSDPKEIDEKYLKSELGLMIDSGSLGGKEDDKKPFARPRGPGRKR